jgi:hypothetical protein
MQSKILVVLGASAILSVSSTAMAGGAHGMGMHGHGHFAHHFNFRRNFVHNFRFGRNLFLGGFGWGDWGWGPYDNSGGGSNTTVVVFPQAIPQAANVTGSVTGSVDPPCHWNQQEFTVPSSAGGMRPVQVVSCR